MASGNNLLLYEAIVSQWRSLNSRLVESDRYKYLSIIVMHANLSTGSVVVYEENESCCLAHTKNSLSGKGNIWQSYETLGYPCVAHKNEIIR